MKSFLIADSGGSKTDWCFIDAKNQRTFFKTESYHPSNWSDDFFKRIANYWEGKDQEKQAELHFFCAGCLKSTNAKELEFEFRKLGFIHVVVKSDLHAAGIASLGKKNGTVAILGTGSVMFDWQDGEVHNVVGGLGHELGDQGSGFYFGKLVYKAYKNGNLNEHQQEILESLDLISIENQIEYGNTKHALSSLAGELKKSEPLFSEWHKINAELFYKTHLSDLAGNELYLVGGYACSYLVYFEALASSFHTKIKGVICAPIAPLVEQIVGTVE